MCLEALVYGTHAHTLPMSVLIFLPALGNHSIIHSFIPECDEVRLRYVLIKGGVTIGLANKLGSLCIAELK